MKNIATEVEKSEISAKEKAFQQGLIAGQEMDLNNQKFETTSERLHYRSGLLQGLSNVLL